MKKYFNLFIMFVFAILVIPSIINATEKEEITRINVHLENGTTEAVYGESITQPTIVIDSTVPEGAKDYLTLTSSTGWHLKYGEVLENGAVFGEGTYELWIGFNINNEGSLLYEMGNTSAIYLDDVKMSSNARNDDYLLNDVSFNLESPAGTPPTITSGSTLTTVNKGDEFYYSLTATGSDPITWSVKEGSSLPTGLSLSNEGVISGTPTVAGNFSFVIVATNEAGSDEKTFSLYITNKEQITEINAKIVSGTKKLKMGLTLIQPEVVIESTVPAEAKDYVTLGNYTGWYKSGDDDLLENGTTINEGKYSLFISVGINNDGQDLYKISNDVYINLEGTIMGPNARGNYSLLNELNFELPEQYTVSFETNGGPSVDSILVNDDSLLPAYLLPPEDEMVKEGFTFIAWYKDEDLTQRFEPEEDRITSNLTLYAKWESNTRYIVTLDPNNGINNESTIPGFKENDEWIIELPSVYEYSTPNGYSFAGWKIDGNIYNAGDTYIVTKNVTAIAQWNESEIEEPTYTIIFDYNGGTKEGKGTLTHNWVGFVLIDSIENMMDGVTAPSGKVLDYLLINGEKHNLNTGIEINKNMTIKYIWKGTFSQTASSTNSITLKWGKIDGAKGYYVQVKSGSKWKTVKTITKNSTISTKITRLSSGKKYVYRVQAYNSKKKVIYTTSNLNAYTKPNKTKLSIKSNTYNSITISYKKVTGASKYEVFRSNSKTGKYTKVGETKDLTYKDKKLTTGKTYYYKVRACNKYCGAYSNVVNKKVTLNKPTFKLTAGKKKAILKPSSVPGEDGYVIEYSLNAKKGFKEVANLDVYTKVYEQEDLKSNKTYYFRIRAYKVINEKPVYSPWSSIKQVTVK